MDLADTIKLEHAGDFRRAVHRYEGLLEQSRAPLERAQLYLRLGVCAYETSETDEAEDYFSKARRLAEGTDGGDEITGHVLLVLGRLDLERGKHKLALAKLTEAERLLGDRPDVIITLAGAMRERGELQQALNALESLETQRLENDVQAAFLDELGAIHLARGDFAAAEKELTAALDLDERAGSEHTAAQSRMLLAEALMGRGRRQEAQDLLHEVECTYGEGDERGLSQLYLLWGQFYEDGGNYASAIKQYNLALELDQRSDDPLGQATAHIRLARTYRRRGQRDRAQDQLMKAGQRLAGSEDDIEKAALLTEEGHLAIAASNYDRAINRFTGALKVAEEDGDQRRIAVARRSLALAHWEDGSQERALELLLSALPILEERGDLREKNELLDDLGAVLIDLDRCTEALTYLQASFELDEMLGSVASKARTLILMGRSYLRTGERRLAGERLRQAEQVYRDADDEEGLANALCQLGGWFVEEGNLDDALTKFQEACRIDSRQQDSVGIARAQRGLASVYIRRGDHRRADELLKEARGELRDKDDPMEQGLLSVEVARLHIAERQWLEAKAELNRAEEHFLATRSPVQLAVCKRLQASIHAVSPATRQRAHELLLEAERTFIDHRDNPQLDDLYDDLGSLLLLMGRPAEARAAVEKSLEIGRTMKWHRGNGRSYLILGRIDLRLARIVQARKDFWDAKECFDEVGDDVGRSEAHLELGDCYRQEGNYDEAVAQYREARRIDRWHGDLRGLSQALRKLGEVYFLRGELERAAESYDQAEDYLRNVEFADDRGLLGLDRGQLFAARNLHDEAITEFEGALLDFDVVGMEDKKTETYRALVASLHSAGRFDDALQYMRQMGLEQAGLWESLLHHLHPKVREASIRPYLQGDYRNAVTNAYTALESMFIERTPQITRGMVSSRIEAWLRPTARGVGPFDEKQLENLQRFTLASFDLFRNPLAHQLSAVEGVDAFVALCAAHFIADNLDAPGSS